MYYKTSGSGGEMKQIASNGYANNETAARTLTYTVPTDGVIAIIIHGYPNQQSTNYASINGTKVMSVGQKSFNVKRGDVINIRAQNTVGSGVGLFYIMYEGAKLEE